MMFLIDPCFAISNPHEVHSRPLVAVSSVPNFSRSLCCVLSIFDNDIASNT